VTTAAHADRFTGDVRVIATTVRTDAADLRRALADLRPDLVQVNLVDPASMVSALEVASAHGPAVATLHMRGEVPDLPRLRAAYAALRALVAVSAEFAAFAREVLGVPDVVHVINGVDPLEPVSLPGGDVPVVGALGRLTAQKGFDVLLEAVRLLVGRGVPLRLLLGGEGRDRAALEQQAAGLPVAFLGFQDGPADLLGRCDAFALSSRVEALPLVLVEAVSAGLPAVSTDVGDVRAALGDVVEVVPVEDPAALAAALQRLLTDPDLRLRRGAAGARRAREALTAQRMASDAWRAFLGPPPRPAPG
jgi:glycosyltransferase involved in cell wall biosynthesis